MISNEREREICIYIYAHGHGCSNQLHDWMIFGYVGHEFGQVSHLSNHLPRMLYRWCFLHNLYTAFNLFYLSWGSLYMRIIHIITYLYLSIYIYIHFYTYILIYIYTYNIYIYHIISYYVYVESMCLCYIMLPHTMRVYNVFNVCYVIYIFAVNIHFIQYTYIYLSIYPSIYIYSYIYCIYLHTASIYSMSIHISIYWTWVFLRDHLYQEDHLPECALRGGWSGTLTARVFSLGGCKERWAANGGN
jgi:hypothetical protein